MEETVWGKVSGAVFFLGGDCPGGNCPGGTVRMGVLSGGEFTGHHINWRRLK